QLRTGDLVECHDSASVKISGELYCFKRDRENNLTQQLEEKEFGVGLEAKNGEKNIIKLKSNLKHSTPFKQVELHAVRDGKQAGVLTGTRLNLFGGNNFFIRVKEEKDNISISGYEKTAII